LASLLKNGRVHWFAADENGQRSRMNARVRSSLTVGYRWSNNHPRFSWVSCAQ